jgi:hypothetical protein
VQPFWLPPEDLGLTEKERHELDWTSPDAPEDHWGQVSDGLQAVANYLTNCFAPYGLYGSRTRHSWEAGQAMQGPVE